MKAIIDETGRKVWQFANPEEEKTAEEEHLLHFHNQRETGVPQEHGDKVNPQKRVHFEK